MTPFSFEHVFVAAAPADVFAAYFDPSHQVEQDRALEIAEREVIEFAEVGDQLTRRCRVVPRRQLPGLLRRFSSGPLHYVEQVVGYRAAHRIEIDLRLFGGRGRVTACYQLEQLRRDPFVGVIRAPCRWMWL